MTSEQKIQKVYKKALKKAECYETLIDVSKHSCGVMAFYMVQQDDGTVSFVAVDYDEDGKNVSQINSEDIGIDTLKHLVKVAKKHKKKHSKRKIKRNKG